MYMYVHCTVHFIDVMCLFIDSERRANKHVGSLPRRCVFLKDTSNDTDSSFLLNWNNIDQVNYNVTKLVLNKTEKILYGKGENSTIKQSLFTCGICRNHTYNLTCMTDYIKNTVMLFRESHM